MSGSGSRSARSGLERIHVRSGAGSGPHLDLVFANGGGFSTPGADQKVRLYMNRGNGAFKDESDMRTGGLSGLYRGVELGDCDRDGDLDVVLAQDFDRLPELLINNGLGVFAAEGGTRLPAMC